MEAPEPKVFQHDRLYIQVDRGIVEVFRRTNVIGPYRYPLAWVTVYAETRRGGRTRLCFGTAEDLGEPVYGSVPGAGPVFFRHEIPTADEPLYRAFFTELAHLADRPIAS
ncbi:hypothetical protein OG949_10905 [Streptomyces scopuliridis]|uniref:Uncharacterized protein n=1 Tax=Streptomyces scopuliridis RB72 TaxID=1440053 RepID=A0A2T7T3S4_9ACTN|nr:hypothetical protein [Streptomyces scopuliridis]PVE09800.1 hypothetical protein Y717_33270 [Streptomyces scopuliridis RB72]WSB33322.1 hypothetical protein OG949_10905 [Streptomyces scopuliridis]